MHPFVAVKFMVDYVQHLLFADSLFGLMGNASLMLKEILCRFSSCRVLVKVSLFSVCWRMGQCLLVYMS